MTTHNPRYYVDLKDLWAYHLEPAQGHVARLTPSPTVCCSGCRGWWSGPIRKRDFNGEVARNERDLQRVLERNWASALTDAEFNFKAERLASLIVEEARPDGRAGRGADRVHAQPARLQRGAETLERPAVASRMAEVPAGRANVRSGRVCSSG